MSISSLFSSKVRLGLYDFKRRLVFKASTSSVERPDFASILFDRSAFVRSLLRRDPSWLEGHLVIAETAARLLDSCERAEVPRLRGELRVSLEAVSALIVGKELQVDEQVLQTLLEAKHLMSERNNQQALLKLEDLLSSTDKVRQLAGRAPWACRLAYQAAMALEERDIAEKYLSRIPDSELGESDKLALSYLQNPELHEKPVNS